MKRLWGDADSSRCFWADVTGMTTRILFNSLIINRGWPQPISAVSSQNHSKGNLVRIGCFTAAAREIGDQVHVGIIQFKIKDIAICADTLRRN